jgi:branched-chain amino acid transport system permease protein
VRVGERYYRVASLSNVSLATLAQALVSGALLGCFYTLMALAFSMILGLTRALNLAHGELIVLGGYLGYWLWSASGVHPLLLIPVSAAALLPLGLLWRWLLERLPQPRELPSLVLTFGLALLLQSLMLALWRGEYRLIADESLTAAVGIAGLRLNQGRLLVALAALAVVGALHLAITRTRWGRAVRATSIDRDAAALLGIDVDRATRATFLLAMAIAGGAGVLFATLHYLYPAGGTDLTLLAIVLTIWAGVGRLRSVLAAGILLGLVEAVTVTWGGPGWREPAVAMLLLASLLARSGGLARGWGH